jgi:hypothetical protein
MQTTHKLSSPIVLSDFDQSEVRRIARLRVDYDMQNKTTYTPYYKQVSRHNVEMESFGAEWAYCTMMGVLPDVNYKHFESYDALVNGHRVDVKWTRYFDGRLQAKKSKDWISPPDYFVLMVGRFPIYFYRGCLRADELIRLERINTNKQHSPVYSADQVDLHPEFY